MKEVSFGSDSIVKIENRYQFHQIYHLLRSYERGVSLQEWVEMRMKLGMSKYPNFPIYLEHANSMYVNSIGFTTDTKNTWTGEEYNVLTFNEAII